MYYVKTVRRFFYDTTVTPNKLNVYEWNEKYARVCVECVTRFTYNAVWVYVLFFYVK